MNEETFTEFCERIIDQLCTKSEAMSGGKELATNEDVNTANKSPLFHKHHYLVMKLKSHLISQYGNTGQMYNNLEESLILRKISLCDEFINVFSKIDTGKGTDWWAITMYEKVRAEMTMDQRRLDAGGISMKEFIDNVRKSIEVWQEIIQILRIEPKGSYLRKIATRTEKEISKAREVVLMAQFF